MVKEKKSFHVDIEYRNFFILLLCILENYL
jgi:hypothetical protein